MRIGWIVVTGLVVCLAACRGASPAESAQSAPPSTPAAIAGPIRLTGTLEAVRSRAVGAPRLAGVMTPMVVTTLARPGVQVREGDLLVQFDPQEQHRIAFDRRAELVDLDSQLERKRADQAAAEAKERTAIIAAANDIERAKLAVATNDLIARVAAEKNVLTLEQHTARLAQLQEAFDLRREAAAADLRILEIKRGRAERALAYAEQNAGRMEIRAPFAGLVVIKTMYRPGQGYVEIVEGDEVRPGMPIIDLVDTSAMQVRARLNQADAAAVRPGMPAVIRLDGFPDLQFNGRVEQVTPLAVVGLSQTVRTFVAVVSIEGAHPQLLPDLTASVEIVPAAATPPAGGAR